MVSSIFSEFYVEFLEMIIFCSLQLFVFLLRREQLLGGKSEKKIKVMYYLALKILTYNVIQLENEDTICFKNCFIVRVKQT